VTASQDEALAERFGPVYIIMTRANRSNPLLVTDKGHMLRRINGQLELDPRSNETIKHEYYTQNPQAPRQMP